MAAIALHSPALERGFEFHSDLYDYPVGEYVVSGVTSTTVYFRGFDGGGSWQCDRERFVREFGPFSWRSTYETKSIKATLAALTGAAAPESEKLK
jgi:hypothetical protein